MNILHVYRTYFPDTQGGVQEVVRQISLGTSKHGIRNRIFTPSVSPEPPVIESPEGEIHRVKLNFEIASCGFCVTGIGEFRKQVAWADLVHYHFPWPFADALHFVAGVRKPTLVTYHSDVIRQQWLLKLYTPLMMQFLRRADRIVCTSPNYQESSLVLNRLQKPCGVIPIGLNRDSYPSVGSGEISRMRSRYGEDFFLFVGLLRYYKGLHTLIEAAKSTRSNIVIVGAGPLERELKELVRCYGLGNVRFAGYLDDTDKVALIHLCRGLVFPSHLRSEAFGVTLLESAMFGKPMISAELGTGTSYVNLDGITGLVVPPEDPAALARAMNSLAEEKERAGQMGRAALDRFESLFTSVKMVDAYLQEYDRLLGSSR